MFVSHLSFLFFLLCFFFIFGNIFHWNEVVRIFSDKIGLKNCIITVYLMPQHLTGKYSFPFLLGTISAGKKNESHQASQMDC